MSFPHRIPVQLGPRRYDVLIGLRHLNRLGSVLRRLGCGTHPVVITNPTILKGPARSVAGALSRTGFPVATLVVADTERSKSMATLSRLLSDLADLDKPGCRPFLVLEGGGVVGDLGGVAAGLYRRGIPYVQVPTTLLAQVDSAIGGKTAVDLPQGKNLVGLFYQPRLVFVELGFLRSLPDRQFRSGLAEAAKCGVIRDPALFRFLERTSVSDLRNSQRGMGWVIARAVKVKASMVEADERETQGIRTLLNFGHTAGHALESATHYSKAYSHGEAIAVGMLVATAIARRLKMIPEPEARRIERLIRHLGLPTTIRRASLSSIQRAMVHDKKWSVASNRWVLPVRIGRAVVRQGVPDLIVRGSLELFLEG